MVPTSLFLENRINKIQIKQLIFKTNPVCHQNTTYKFGFLRAEGIYK